MSAVSVAQGDGSELPQPPTTATRKGSTLTLDVETIRLYASSVVTRLRERVTMDTLRPLPMFLGVTGPAFCMSPEAFSPPMRHMDRTALEKIRARLKLNLNFFLTNYALVAFGVSVVVALLHPGMLFFVGLVWGLWWLHEFMITNEVVFFGRNLGTMISISRRSLILSIITAIVIVWKCLLPFLSVALTSGFLIIIHAVLRDPKHIETSSTFRGRSSDGELDSDDSGEDSEVMVERGDII